ncbi:OmpA family protein [soil metagenome]
MKKFICCVILLSSLSYFAIGQELRTSLADSYFQNFQYQAAAKVYEKIHHAEPYKITIVDKLVICYLKLNNTEKAEFWLEKAVQSDSLGKNHYLNYAAILASNNKHDLAKEWLVKASKNSPDKEILNRINSYEKINQFYADSALYHVSPVPFNSAQSDFSPVFYKSGIVFCSARDNGKIAKYKYDFDNSWFIDLYHVKDSLSSPTLFSNRINSRYHEGPVAFNHTFDTIYFTRNQVSGKNRSNSEGVNKLKIYFASIKDGKWGTIQGFPLNNRDYSIGHPTFVSPNEMIFVSDMPGGFGGTDLYKTIKINGTWHEPVNMGPQINTSGNELFPFADNEGGLYFASNGHPGLGGLDIFHTSLQGKVTIKNLGYPINTPKDDFGIIIQNNTGYFSSNRDNSAQTDNIYSFSINKNKWVYIYAKGEDGNFISDVDLVIHLSKAENVNSKIENEILKINWKYENVDKIYFSKSGYNDQQLIFDNHDYHQLKNGDTLTVTLNKKEEPKEMVEPVVAEAPILFINKLIGQIIELDIKYDVNKASINNDAAEKLNILVEYLKSNPEVKVELGSHTDSRGSAELNQKLSKKRAESAVEYVYSKGINKERLVATGFGKNQLKIPNAVIEEEHRQNRRTTITIIE